MMSWIDLHKFANVIFGITQKLLYITWSILVRKYVTNKGIFLNLFRDFSADASFKPIQDGLFRGSSRMVPKICHTYPAMTKLGTVIS